MFDSGSCLSSISLVIGGLFFFFERSFRLGEGDFDLGDNDVLPLDFGRFDGLLEELSVRLFARALRLAGCASASRAAIVVTVRCDRPGELLFVRCRSLGDKLA